MKNTNTFWLKKIALSKSYGIQSQYFYYRRYMARSNSLNLYQGQEQGLDIDRPYLSPDNIESINQDILQDILFGHQSDLDSNGHEKMSDDSTVGSKDKSHVTSKHSSSSRSLALSARKSSGTQSERSVLRSKTRTASKDEACHIYETNSDLENVFVRDPELQISVELKKSSLNQFEHESPSEPVSHQKEFKKLGNDNDLDIKLDGHDPNYSDNDIQSQSACKVDMEDIVSQTKCKIDENYIENLDLAENDLDHDLQDNLEQGLAEVSPNTRYLIWCCTFIVNSLYISLVEFAPM